MIKYFIENRISAFMVFLAFVVTGGISLLKMPVSLLPASGSPALSVIIDYPGITPGKIETIITKPVERILKTVGGIIEMNSESGDGRSRINISFADDVDIRIAALNVREKIELIRDSFPEEVQEPVVMRYDPSDRPVMIAAVEIKGLEIPEVRDYVERRIKPSLQRVSGLSEINVAGGDIKEIHVDVDRSLLEGRGLSLNDIASEIDAGNVSLPCGVVETAGRNIVLHLPGRYRNPGEIKDVIVRSIDGRSVYVKDIAEVGFSQREKGELSRYNRKEMVTIYIHKGSGSNTLNVCREIKKILASFNNVKITYIYNQGEYVQSSIINAAFSGLWGVVIVASVLFFIYRNGKSVLPVVLSIPASLIIVPLFLRAAGIGLNVMSLSGFALGAGVVVSNGIIIMEIILSHGGGEDIVYDSVSLIKRAVVSSTLTSIIVFFPVIFLNGKSSSAYRDMAYTVVWALLVSLFVSLVLVPSFYISFNRILKIKSGRIDNSRPALCKRKIFTFMDSVESNMISYYKAVLKYSFVRRERIIVAAAVVFFISMVLFSFIKTDSNSDNGGDEFYVFLEFPTGFSLDATDRGVSEVESAVSGIKGLKNVSVKTEKWRGTLTVKPEPGLGIKTKNAIKNIIKERSNDLLKKYGGFAYLSEADEMASREITLHFTGNNTDVLKGIAREASSAIKRIEGINECFLRFRDGRPEYVLAVDKARASSACISHVSIADGIRNGLFGPVITRFIDNDREVDVRVRFKNEDRDNINKIISGGVISEKGEMVNYAGLVSIAESGGVTKINRMNGRRVCSVTVAVGSLSLQEAEYKIRKALETIRIPDEYSWEFDRRLKDYKNEKKELAASIVLSIILIYMILASQFESFRLPFLIMISIPFAACGISPFLLVTGTPLTPSVYLGIIVLSGIVVNNGIILLDAINIAISRGSNNPAEITVLIKETSIEKFRPVFITTITVILSMLPMLIDGGDGSSLWRPFAMTVISGILFSSALTLVILPVMCIFFYNKQTQN